MESEVAAALAGELRLLDPEVRSSPDLAGALLDPEWTEVGRSGHFWTRAAMLAALPGMATDGGTPLEPLDLQGIRIAPGAVLVTYRTQTADGAAYRSSVWRRGADGAWRMLHHQATPTAG